MSVSADALLTWAERYPQLALLFNPGASIEEHDNALERLVDGAVRWLEDNANYLKNVGEDHLSTTLAGKISMPGLRVIREGNVNGHVDITIEPLAKGWSREEFLVRGDEIGGCGRPFLA